MSEIFSAFNQYKNRPADERLPSLQALVDRARADREASREVVGYNLKDLKVGWGSAGLGLHSPQGTAAFTHWSFGQMCRLIGAPAPYLRTLSPQVAASAMNEGIAGTAPGTTSSILMQRKDATVVVRAMTSDTYKRVWDSVLFDQILNVTAPDGRWTLPPTWSGEPAGAYRGDRDSFLILVSGGSIVTDPSAGSSGQMFRGLLVRNSEVGASSIVLEEILYRYVCGNHILWGAVVDKAYRRRHVGKADKDTISEINRFALNYVERSESRDRAIIQGLISHEVAHTKEGVIDSLRAIGATKEQANAAWQAALEHEAAPPTSYWGISQGLTRVSQESGFQDQRFDLDVIASKLLTKGATLVAA